MTKILFVCLDKNNIIHASKIINEYKKKSSDFNLFFLYDENHKTFINIDDIEHHRINIDKLLKEISACGLDLYKRNFVLDTFLNKITKYYFDLIINLDYELPFSSVIVSYLNSKNIWGPYYDEYGFTCFDNNKYKFLVHSKQNMNLFFYPELINSSLNISFNFSKKEELKVYDNFFIVTDNHKDANYLSSNQINDTNYIANAKEYKLCITDNCFVANFNALNNIKTIFISSEYKNFYNVYPYNECVKYILSKDFIQAIEGINNNTNIFFKTIQDKFSYIYIVPETTIDLDKDVLTFFILKAVWKSMVVKETLVGDSKKFVSLGEKYFDRIMDINVEIDFIKDSILNNFNKNSILSKLPYLEDTINQLCLFKKIAFEGINISKSYLSVVSSASCDFEKIKIKNKELIDHDKKIIDYNFNDIIINDFIYYFKNERNNYHLKNLFPMVKEIILTYETLYSKICFYEEILKGLIRGVKNA